MNKWRAFISSLMLTLVITTAFFAEDAINKYFKSANKSFGSSVFAVGNSSIINSYLGKYVRLDVIPEGVYYWQNGMKKDEAVIENEGKINKSIDLEESYRNIKFKDNAKPWIKMLVKSDKTFVFTSRGIISRPSDSIQELELVSNRILTKIKEEKGIKFFEDSDPSTKNVYAAIYNALSEKINITAPALLKFDDVSGHICYLRVNDIICGAYFETVLPGYFNEVRTGLLIKVDGQISRLFIIPGKSNFYSNNGARSSDFLDRFEGLLVSDIDSSNSQLINKTERSSYIYSRESEIINFWKKTAPQVKVELENYIISRRKNN